MTKAIMFFFVTIAYLQIRFFAFKFD